MARIEIREPVLLDQRMRAARWREAMRAQGTLVVNLMSSPGAGKTALLEATAARLARDYTLAALVGDIATDRDAQRLQRWMPARQLTTGGACHLDIGFIESSRQWVDELGPLDILFVENVGNLVCPASFDLGEHLRVVLLAVTEGDDKPQKYPKAFRTAGACVLSKADLLPYVPFSVEAARRDALAIQPGLKFFETSALADEGLAAWCDFLVTTRHARTQLP